VEEKRGRSWADLRQAEFDGDVLAGKSGELPTGECFGIAVKLKADDFGLAVIAGAAGDVSLLDAAKVRVSSSKSEDDFGARKHAQKVLPEK